MDCEDCKNERICISRDKIGNSVSEMEDLELPAIDKKKFLNKVTEFLAESCSLYMEKERKVEDGSQQTT